MGIFDIFSKEKRDRAQSIFDYDACRKHRELKLLSFRHAMRDQFSFEYPDGFILSNQYCRSFLVYSKGSGLVQKGNFADDVYPKIEYFTVDASTSDRLKELQSYAAKVKNATGNICKDEMKRFDAETRTLYDEYKKGFIAKGFSIISEMDLNYVYGAAIYLNGRTIAISTIWKKQPSSHFSKALQKHVIEGRPTERGTSVVELVIGCCNPINERWEFRYDILFDDGCDFSKVDDNNGYKKAIAELNAFMFAFECEINGGKDPEDFWSAEHPGSLCSREEMEKQRLNHS